MIHYDIFTDKLVFSNDLSVPFLLKKTLDHRVEEIVEDERGYEYYLVRDSKNRQWAIDCVPDQNASLILGLG